MLHRDIPAAQNHGITAWTVAAIADLATIPGLVAGDEGKVAFVSANGGHYYLEDYSVPTWRQMNAVPLTISTSSASTYTLSAAEASIGSLMSFTHATNCAVTLDSAGSHPVGSVWNIYAAGTGTVTLTEAGSMDIIAPPYGTLVVPAKSCVTVIIVATNTAQIIGFTEVA